MIFFIIYIIGYILAYNIVKVWERAEYESFFERNWGDVFFGLLISFFSWIVPIIYFISKIKINSKPPKWL